MQMIVCYFDQNIWQINGLCNGSTGHMVDIIYSNQKSPPGLPDCFIVDFGNNYSGPPLFGNDQDCKIWVPISPDHYEFKTSSVAYKYGTDTSTRTMMTILLCCDWTIWKSQR